MANSRGDVAQGATNKISRNSTSDYEKLKKEMVEMKKENHELKQKLVNKDKENAQLKSRIHKLDNCSSSSISQSSTPTEPASNSGLMSNDEKKHDIIKINTSRKRRIIASYNHKDMGFNQFEPPQMHATETRKTELPPTLSSENFPSLRPAWQPSTNSSPNSAPSFLPSSSKNCALLPAKQSTIQPQSFPKMLKNSSPKSVLPPVSIPSAPSSLPFPSEPKSLKHNIQEIMMYSDSNQQKLPRNISAKIKGPANIKIMRTYTMQKTLEEVRKNDHKNALVVINIMTNNARRKETLMSVRGYQEKIIAKLKTETSPKNIVFIACPPSTKFNTDCYNKSTEYLCKTSKVRFSKSLICIGHLNHDGYHVCFQYQHLMSKTVAAAILNVDPFEAIRMRPDSRGLLGPYRKA